jgi:geranylgeranyl pyrophosphate synthase
MIHTASLVHDDVLDDCNTRRGARPARRLCSVPRASAALSAPQPCAGQS